MALEDLAMFILTAWLPCFRGGRAQPDGARGPGHVPRAAGLDGVLPERRGLDGVRGAAGGQHPRRLPDPRQPPQHPRHLRQHRALRCRETEGESLPPSSTTTPSGSLSGNWRWVVTPVIYDNTERFAVGKLKVSHHPVIYHNNERFAVGKLKVSHHPRHLRRHRAVRCREIEGESSPPSSTTTPSGSPSANWRWVITPVIYDNTERFAVGKLKVSHFMCIYILSILLWTSQNIGVKFKWFHHVSVIVWARWLNSTNVWWTVKIH